MKKYFSLEIKVYKTPKSLFLFEVGVCWTNEMSIWTSSIWWEGVRWTSGNLRVLSINTANPELPMLPWTQDFKRNAHC
jgi:hypothetical protein